MHCHFRTSTDRPRCASGPIHWAGHPHQPDHHSRAKPMPRPAEIEPMGLCLPSPLVSIVDVRARRQPQPICTAVKRRPVIGKQMNWKGFYEVGHATLGAKRGQERRIVHQKRLKGARNAAREIKAGDRQVDQCDLRIRVRGSVRTAGPRPRNPRPAAQGLRRTRHPGRPRTRVRTHDERFRPESWPKLFRFVRA